MARVHLERLEEYLYVTSPENYAFFFTIVADICDTYSEFIKPINLSF